MKKNPDSKAGKKPLFPMQSKKKKEIDADDLVHEEKEEQPSDAGLKDRDDIAHSTYNSRVVNKDDNLEDPDDLVHDHRNDDE